MLISLHTNTRQFEGQTSFEEYQITLLLGYSIRNEVVKLVKAPVATKNVQEAVTKMKEKMYYLTTAAMISALIVDLN
jgi:hypothetical protein